MLILKKYRLLERLLGFHPPGGRINICLRIIHLISYISFAWMELSFIILNIRDGIDKVASALAPFCGILPAIACCVHLLIYRERYHCLLNEMQDIVNGSILNSVLSKDQCWYSVILGMKNDENKVFYTHAEQKNTTAAKIAFCSQLVNVFSLFTPFIFVTYHWCVEKYTIDSWFFFYPFS